MCSDSTLRWREEGKIEGGGSRREIWGREGEGKFKGGGRGKGNLRGREGGRKI